MTITEKFQMVDAAEFGRRIAQAFHDDRSSTALFFIQQAFKDCDDDNGIYWELFDEMLTRIKTDNVSGPVCHNCGQPQGVPSPDCRYCCLKCMPPKEQK